MIAFYNLRSPSWGKTGIPGNTDDILFTRQFNFDLVPMAQKVAEMSTLNLSMILMWGISL